MASIKTKYDNIKKKKLKLLLKLKITIKIKNSKEGLEN